MHWSLIAYPGALALLILPGAWLAFGLPLQPISFPARLAIAGALSPLVVALQYYAVRFLGASFETTATILLVLNLGSVWLVARRWKDLHFSAAECAAFVAVFLILAACVMVPWATNDSFRLYHSHQWMYSGIVYEISQGQYTPEEPELAGLRLRYPWSGHIYWAVLSWVMDAPPTRTFILTNVFSLAVICILVYEICGLCGARPFARLTAIIAMALGTGAANYYWHILFGGKLHGDIRYTPWLRKFTTAELSVWALAMFTAIVFLAVLALQNRSRARLALILVLLGGIGLVYPLIFPQVAGFCGVLFLFMARKEWWGAHKPETKLAAEFLAGIILVGLAALVYVRWLTQGSSIPVARPALPLAMIVKMGSGVLALLPLFIGVGLVGWRKITQREDFMLLLGGAIPGYLCYVLLRLSEAYNEYKFMFGLAMCLAPVAALALERLPQKIPGAAAVLTCALLFVPVMLAKDTPIAEAYFLAFPRAEEGNYRLRLAPEEPDAGWTNAIRESTPKNTILVVRRSGLFLPTLTERSELAPPEATGLIPGYWLTARENLLGVRGYPVAQLEQRTALEQRLFECTQDSLAEEIGSQLRSLHRPVAIVFFPGEGTFFQSWLARGHRAQIIFSEARGATVWLLSP